MHPNRFVIVLIDGSPGALRIVFDERRPSRASICRRALMMASFENVVHTTRPLKQTSRNIGLSSPPGVLGRAMG
jgi:hypothetical protein